MRIGREEARKGRVSRDGERLVVEGEEYAGKMVRERRGREREGIGMIAQGGSMGEAGKDVEMGRCTITNKTLTLGGKFARFFHAGSRVLSTLWLADTKGYM